MPKSPCPIAGAFYGAPKNRIRTIRSVFAILAGVCFTQMANAQSYYITNWNIGSSSGSGFFSTFEAAGQVAVETTNRNYNNAGYSLASCLPGGPTSGSIVEACTIDQFGGPIIGAVFVYGAASPSSRKDVGNACPSCGDPIVMAIGNKILEDKDFIAGGESPLRFTRFYNSSPVALSSSLFQGWAHSYSASVNTNSSTSVFVTRADGKAYTFNLTNGVWISDLDVNDTLTQLTSGGNVTGWQYNNANDDSLETYDAYGNLSSIVYRDGKLVALTYATGGSASTFPAQLMSVADNFGNALTFSSSSNPLTMTDPNGERYAYMLGGSEELSSVTYPDNTTRTFLYNESGYTGGTTLTYSLTGVVDENNSRFDSTWYDSSGNAVQTSLAGGVERYSLTNTLDSNGRIQSVSFVDPLGATRGNAFTSSVGRNRLSSFMQPAASGQPMGTQIFAFDANGNTIESTDLNGNVNCSVFDLTRNLETGRVEGMAPSSTCPSNIAAYVPTAGTVQRKILTQWHPVWHLPAQRAEPLKITTWVYNGDGGSYCAPTTAKVGINPIGVVCSRSEQGTTDATGGAGFGATASGPPRVWTYTYNSFGQVLTINGPRTDVSDITTYTYYTCDTGGRCGQIDTITNALGQVTTFLSYDGNGNPLTISDPNGLITTLTYDARQHLKSRQIGSETTSYSYYPTGLLDVVTLPDGSTVQYTYDAAHRLTKITDGAGNYISYTLDAMGNRTAENSFDSTGSLHRTHTRVFNTLSTLYQDITAAGTTAATTTYGYDAQGNQTSVAAPLSRNTGNAFDTLNRLNQITDPAGGVTHLEYDAKDNVTSVTDPRSLSTTYANDGFGDVVQQVSPDTGTTINTYDSAGNLKTATDARGALATYTYDALNRVNQVAYSDQVINFTYDAGTNGIGRLTGASDANHALSWAYDTHGRVIGKGQTIGSVTKSVGYGYTNDDLTSLVTPSGQTITYGYANHRITSISINGKALLSGVAYEPFGSVNAWTWGNSTTVGRIYSTDEQVTQLTTAGDVIKFGYDNALRLTSVADKEVSANSWSAGYDVLVGLPRPRPPGRLTAGPTMPTAIA